MYFISELWQFMRVRKKFWLLPLLLVMVLVGGLLVVVQGTAVAGSLDKLSPGSCNLCNMLGYSRQCFRIILIDYLTGRFTCSLGAATAYHAHGKGHLD
jgi:hypothetical protein